MTTLIAYYRVSTQRQGDSGLGLEAQQHAVQQYAASNKATVKASFTEIESGKKNNRPELAKAIAEAKRLGARLCIAKLDRLGRNVHFVSGLMESGVDFFAVDNPNATRLTIHILAAVAEDEAVRISQRTKAALETAKRRGVQLGTPENLTDKARCKGTAANCEAAQRHTEAIKPLAESLRREGRTLRQIAAFLTERGFTTRTGASFSAMAVQRMLA